MVEGPLAEVGRDAQRLGPGRPVLEPPRVGHETGVQAGRRRGGDLAADPPEQPVHHLRRRGRRGVDHGDRAEALVAHVVVEPDHLAGLGDHLGEHAEPVERGRVAGDEDLRR